MNENHKERGLLMEYEKKKTLFLEQKKTLDTFLKTGAISKMQYDKSYSDLVRKMGMEIIAERISNEVI